MRTRVYIIWMGREAYPAAIRAARDLRRAGVVAELAPVEQKLGKALGQADKRAAQYALILGDDEVATGQYTVKTLRTGTQEKVQKDRLLEYMSRLIDRE